MASMQHSQSNFQMSENTTVAQTSNSSLQCGVVQLQHTIEMCMKNHWEDFRRDSQQHFTTFHTDYIEPSIQFIETEKKNADEKHRLLENEYNQLKNKCSDLERYNTLLQEKIEAVETEMKSFSQVSMIAKWEKRLHDKTKEYTSIQASLDKSKEVVHRLKQENTVLNTRLEMLEKDAHRRNFVSSARSYLQHTAVVAPVMISTTSTSQVQVVNAVDSEAGEPLTNDSNTNGTEPSDVDVHHDTGFTSAQTIPNDIALEPCVESTLEESNQPNNEMSDEPVVQTNKGTSNNELHRISVVETKNESVEPESDKIACEINEKTTPTEAVDDSENKNTHEQPEENAAVSTLLPKSENVQKKTSIEDEPDPANERGVDSDVLTTTEQREPDIKYKIKMLKRSRNDAEKTKYLFGSDKNLYEWTEGDVPGAIVGQQLEKNGRNVFKFGK